MSASLWIDLLNLIYPTNCAACGRKLRTQETVICLFCEYDLPTTQFHTDPENPVAKQFWGRVPLQNATACYWFGKGSRVQRLLHQLKYKKRQEVGVKVGNLYGTQLRQNPSFATVDIIVPIPLHMLKLAQRGYNQSASFAKGLSQSMHIPCTNKALLREVFTATQTKKSRFERWENVSDIFMVADANMLQGKHVLLVDDVITTGATIEACAHSILKLPATTVSVASIAYAPAK